MDYKKHYFDWAATSPADEDILNEAVKISLENWGNPSGSNTVGKKAKTILEEARSTAAKALGVKPDTIYFTSGGTESNQIPLLAVMSKPLKGTVLISSIEHPAVKAQAEAMKHCGWNVVEIPSNTDGIIEPEAVTSLLTNDTMIVAVMAVNNETGSIQPIYEIADAITKSCEGKRRPKFHVDCVQAAGKISIDLNYKGIDSAALSSHKICGPRGIGILYMKDSIEPFLRGGGQEKGIRSGTENVLGAVAFSKCLLRYFNKDNSAQKAKTDEFIEQLSKIPGCTIVPPSRIEKKDLFSPFIVQAAFAHIPGNVMLRSLDAIGFYISTGSACSSKKNSRPVLEAMHVPSEIRETAVRFSFGQHTTPQAIDELYDAILSVTKQFNR